MSSSKQQETLAQHQSESSPQFDSTMTTIAGDTAKASFGAFNKNDDILSNGGYNEGGDLNGEKKKKKKKKNKKKNASNEDGSLSQ